MIFEIFTCGKVDLEIRFGNGLSHDAEPETHC